MRMQRTGRKGNAQFRVVVQDSHTSPTSGRVVAQVGSYNPHTKAAIIDSKKASFYLGNGAHPSPRVAALLKKEGVKLPSWVPAATKKKSPIKNALKLRRNRPEEPKAAEPKEPVSEEPAEAPAKDTDSETPVETETKEQPLEEPAAAKEETSTEAELAEAVEASVKPPEVPEAVDKKADVGSTVEPAEAEPGKK